jgi:AraC-like DNA-binding protein
MGDDNQVTVRSYRMCPPLRPYFTALYATSVDCPAGVWLEDWLHPEWAVLRLTQGPPPHASGPDGAMVPRWNFVVNGPTSEALRFSVTRSRVWGLGLKPAGWAKFVAAPASDFANRMVDGEGHPAFAGFAGLLARINSCGDDQDQAAAEIDRFVMQMADWPVPHEDRIIACQDALRDPEVSTAAQLQDRLGMTARSLERLCHRYFGFTPKLLLRRQRFLRSLIHFLKDGHGNWSEALDAQYHDQAQFVREFRAFMGMTPSEYARTPHPVIGPMLNGQAGLQRGEDLTDLPTIMRYGQPATK